MNPEIGHFLLIFALGASFLQALLPLWGMWRNNANLLGLAAPLQLAVTLAALGSFIVLTIGFITSDFSIELVAQHSHSQKPMIYKFSGVWGNHEGSLLLWILVLGLFGGAFALRQKAALLPRYASVLMVYGWITSAFIGFSLFTSNPFSRLDPAPIEGMGLNPILQDIGLALHPPMLYLGYVGLAVAFAFAVAGLIRGEIDQLWARMLQPWVSAAWSTLTVGIVLGSWWAYYELGWGGWWFWDPVENASLMPWLVATALMHSAIVLEKRGMMKNWTVLLAIMGFSLSLIGTFIVRSGLLTSVHSFASDPSRGLFVLGILVFAVGIPLILYTINGPKLHSTQDYALKSREVALTANNFLLVTAAAIVLLGTFYPLGLEVWNGAKISVGPPFYDATFLPIMSLGLIGMVFGAVTVWKRGLLPHAKKLLIGAIIALVTGAVVTLGVSNESIATLAGIGLACWLVFGIAADLWLRVNPLQAEAMGRLKSLTSGVWGMWLGHLGVAVLLIGALGEGIAQTEVIVRAQPGTEIALGKDRVVFEKIVTAQGPNYLSLQAHLRLFNEEGQLEALLIPERRNYPAERQTTTEAAIRSSLFADYYTVLGDGNPQAGYTLRLYHKPLLPFLWLGGAIMALGGLIAAFGRRNRPLMR